MPSSRKITTTRTVTIAGRLKHAFGHLTAPKAAPKAAPAPKKTAPATATQPPKP